jgi:DNA-directed RNA polymerase sigma subunit (sigma70/sigma32)
MRGKRLFQSIRTEATEPEKNAATRVQMLTQRDECLLVRYYFYVVLKGLNYEDTLYRLRTEFFISPDRIARIVEHNLERLRQLKENKLSKYKMKDKWPQFKW